MIPITVAVPQATILERVIAGLDHATEWIAGHATDGDGHNDAVRGIQGAYGVLSSLEAVYGPRMVNEILDRAMQVAQGVR